LSGHSEPATVGPHRPSGIRRHGHVPHRKRHPELFGIIRVCEAGEAARRNADDRERVAIDRDRSIDDGWVGAELLAPQRITQHADRMRTRNGVLVGSERASEYWANSEDVEIVS